MAGSHQAQWNSAGFVVVRRFFDPSKTTEAASEAQQLLRRSELIHTDNLRCRWKSNPSGECLFETFDPIVDLSPAAAQIATDDRLFALLGELCGEPAQLFKDKLIYKPPGAEGYGLHQDFIAWPTFPRSFLTVLVPLDAATEENGCTEVFSGYHTGGCLSIEDGDYHELPESAVDPSRGVKLLLEPGDIAIFGGFTPHRSGPNRSSGYRRQLYLSYNKDSDGGDQRQRHYAEFQKWLHGKYAQYGRTNVYFR